MKLLKDSKENRYELIEPAMISGGEGLIFELRDQPELVAKIYKTHSSENERREKLEVMLRTPPAREDIHHFTWPVEMLFDNEDFVGFVMPRIRDFISINRITASEYAYNLKDRLTVAKNLCAAVNAAHFSGHVCGDLNSDNILVDPITGLVTLIDCDSFQITDPSRQSRFACKVGLPEVLPLEVQKQMREGKTLSDAPWGTFSRQSDYFILSIYICMLLLNVHPFKCFTDSDDSPEPEDNIYGGHFPYVHLKSGESLPLCAPSYDYLPSDVRSAIENTFIAGHDRPEVRTDARTWKRTLDSMQKSLIKCKDDPEHQYPSNASACPWCERDRKLRAFLVANESILDNSQIISTSSAGASGSARQPTLKHSVPAPRIKPNVSAAVQRTIPGYSQVYTSSGQSGPSLYASGAISTGFTDFLSSTFGFWFITIFLAVLTQIITLSFFGDQLMSSFIGTEYRTNLFCIGINLAIWIGPIGMSIAALAVMGVYNFVSDGKCFGYSPKNYILSYLSSVLGMGAYFVLMWILSIFIGIFLIGLVLYIIFCLFS